jgi:DNA-binding response OmpR family regulator
MTTRVLIVDDEEHIRRVMRMTLEAAGYEVGEAEDGQTGLEQFGDGKIWAAVLLDQRMPGMDGLETLRRMKERNADVRIIMVTAYGSIELAVDAMKLGATDFVRKPMTPEILRNAVTAALAGREGPPAPQLPRPGAERPGRARPLVSRATMNGFRFWPMSESTRPASNQRAFAVEHPDGRVEPVRVEISPEVARHVEDAAHRQFPAAGEFWTIQCEKALSSFLWNHGMVPPDGTLSVQRLDQAAMDVALRWDSAD